MKQTNAFDSPKACKLSKYNFNNAGSPEKNIPRNPSNESFEDLRRAPKKELISEERRTLYEQAGKEVSIKLNFDNLPAESPSVSSFSILQSETSKIESQET